jgi:hypothetical protein
MPELVEQFSFQQAGKIGRAAELIHGLWLED